METVEPPGLTCAVVVTTAQVKDESEESGEDKWSLGREC